MPRNRNQRILAAYAKAAAQRVQNAQRALGELIFCTDAASPAVVDLTPYRDGRESLSATSRRRTASFSRGRPQLIAQLEPLLYEYLKFSPSSSMSGWQLTLRTWWKYLDRLEAPLPGAEPVLIESVEGFTSTMFQDALDNSVMHAQLVLRFFHLIRTTRERLGLPTLTRPSLKVGQAQPARSIVAKS